MKKKQKIFHAEARSRGEEKKVMAGREDRQGVRQKSSPPAKEGWLGAKRADGVVCFSNSTLKKLKKEKTEKKIKRKLTNKQTTPSARFARIHPSLAVGELLQSNTYTIKPKLQVQNAKKQKAPRLLRRGGCERKRVDGVVCFFNPTPKILKKEKKIEKTIEINSSLKGY